MQVKDKCHASRRITSITWQCDAYLARVTDVVVLGELAIAKKSKQSGIFKARFAHHVENQELSLKAKVRDLSSAPHRFDSRSKPFGRAVLNWHALISTARDILAERGASSDAGQCSRLFLAEAKSDEAYVQLAMLSDAGDENMQLVRFFDTGETFDKTKVNAVLSTCLRNVHYLFVDRGADRNQSSYTHYAVELLAQRRFLVSDSVHACSVGGGRPEAAVMDRAYGRMMAWVKLAPHVIQAEFPGFETLQAFGGLNLDGNFADDRSAQRLAQVSHAIRAQSRQALARPWERLKQSIDFVRPLAQRLRDSSGDAQTESAWKSAWSLLEMARGQSSSRAGARKVLQEEGFCMLSSDRRIDCAALKDVLVLLLDWGWSTSSVERLFAAGHCTARPTRAELSEDLVCDELQLFTNEGDDLDICKAASASWPLWYGTPRRGSAMLGTERADKGKQHNWEHTKRHGEVVSEHDFLKQRRLSHIGPQHNLQDTSRRHSQNSVVPVVLV